MKATYVSVWDGGYAIESPCKIDLKTTRVFDVEQVDVEELDLLSCDEEYIVLPDGRIIKDFLLDDAQYINGEAQ